MVLWCTDGCGLFPYYVQVEGLRFELRTAYLKLLTALHLDHKVQTKLLTRGEFVLPRYECTKSVPLFMTEGGEEPPTYSGRRESRYRLRNAPLPCCNILASSIQHNITSNFSQTTEDIEPTVDFCMTELIELLFHSLERLLHSDHYKMCLLPIGSRSQVFVPMIEGLDHLLVMGVLKEERDLQRLLHLLDPNQFGLTDTQCECTQGQVLGVSKMFVWSISPLLWYIYKPSSLGVYKPSSLVHI